MNIKQRKLLTFWLIFIIIISPIFILISEIAENWRIISIPVFFIGLFLFTLLKNKKSIADAGSFNEYALRHHWVKVYFRIYISIIIGTLLYIIFYKPQITYLGELMVSVVIFLVLPVIIGPQVERYKELGKEPNK